MSMEESSGAAKGDAIGDEEEPRSGVTARRGWVQVGIIAVIAAGVVFAAISLRPAWAYRSQAPEQSVITGSVELTSLDDVLITQGAVVPRSVTSVSCEPGSGGEAGATRVFTREPRPGATIKEGDVLAEVNGRPVIVLKGKVSAFRAITPGIAGADVKQLEKALKRLGYLAKADDTYTKATESGVKELYGAAGVKPSGPTPEQAGELRAAEERLSQARASLGAARVALTQAQKGPSRSERLAAEFAVFEAQRAYDAAPPGRRKSEQMQLAMARASLEELLAPRDVSAEREAIATLDREVKGAKTVLEKVRATTGISVPYCEIVFVPDLPAVITSADTAGGGDSDEGGAPGEAGWATLSARATVMEAPLPAGHVGEIDDTMVAQVDLGGTRQELPIIEVREPQGVAPATAIIGGLDTVDDFPDEGSFRITIPLSAEPKETLAVPIIAVVLDGEGRHVVHKVSPTGDLEVVPVATGSSARGLVGVTPTSDARLEAGDRVRVFG
ncbi:MAG: peptidoglycan-binding protein [Propioniciclava sp.]